LAIFGKPRYLGLLDLQEPVPAKGAWLVAETMRGMELALLGGPLSPEQEERYRNSCSDDSSDSQVKGGEPSLQEIAFVREATQEDTNDAALEREEENSVLLKGRELLRNHNLSMKLVDVEFLLDRKKLFFYFTSEQRVDFRAFVRDLAKEFKTRIELRQIGVRDEAKAVKGLGPCGQRCCCSYWLHRFTPICIKMVKEQNLALNPTKISGICGRLMCCMSFEHHLYGDLWKGLPNPGSKIRTSGGNYLIDGVDLSAESVRIRTPEGKEILVKTDDFQKFRDTVMEGNSWEGDGLKEIRNTRDEPFRPGRKRTPENREETAGDKTAPRQERRKTEEKAAMESSEEKVSTPQEGTAKKKRRRKRKPSQGEKVPAPEVSSPEVSSSEPPSSAADKPKPQEDQENRLGSGQKKRPNTRRRRPQKGNRDNHTPKANNSSSSPEV
jgi:cell fate regulator YaaT (PSP1 superfamily)